MICKCPKAQSCVGNITNPLSGLLSTPNPQCGLFQVFCLFLKCVVPWLAVLTLAMESTLGDNINVVVNRIY